MANVNRAFGFRMVKNAGKTVFAVKYKKTATVVLYPGDAAKLVAAGTASKFARGDAKVLGIVAEYAAADAEYVWIYDDPTAEYYVQISTFAAADVGMNTDISGTDTPDTRLRHSGQTLLASDNATTVTLPFKLLDLAVTSPAQELGAYAIVRVKINNSVKGGDGSTGI